MGKNNSSEVTKNDPGGREEKNFGLESKDKNSEIKEGNSILLKLLIKMQSGGILTPQEFELFFKGFSSKQFMEVSLNETKDQNRRIKLFMNGESDGLKDDESFINVTTTIMHWMTLAYNNLYLSKSINGNDNLEN